MYTVCMSIYKNDNPEYFLEALESILNQTLPPGEIIIVIDGPVDNDMHYSLENVDKDKGNIKIIYLENNVGLADARQIAINEAAYEYIAVMDSDDISIANRFEKQISCFKSDPELDIVGGQIVEFVNTVDNIVGIRNVPLSHEDIIDYLKKRSPLNHVTVMFKKSSVLEAGGYIKLFCNEDYYLWVRMYEHGCKFYNLSENLVFVRVGKEMYKRRGGIDYFKSELFVQKYLLMKKYIGLPRYVINVTIRIFIQLLLPSGIRGYIFQKIFRKKVDHEEHKI